MPALLLTSLLAVGVALAIRGHPRVTVWVLTTTWLLVPGAARVPGTGAGQLLIHRVIVVAVILGLLRAVFLGRLPTRIFAIRGVHVAFLAFLAVGLVTGVLLAEPRIPASLNFNTYLGHVEQGVFFITALAVFRSVGARHAAVVISVVAGVLGAIAVSEQLVSWSYSQWLTRSLADPSGLLSLDLTTRGPHERVRAAATFALELGWVVALLLPLTVAAAMGARRWGRALWGVPAVLLLAMVWTWSRSAYAGLAVGLLVLGLGVVLDRPHRIPPLGVVGLLLGALLLQGPLRTTLDLGQTQGERDVRFERLPELFDLASERPVGGLGLGGLLVRQFTAVDLSWVNTYATLGVLGVTALAGLLLTAAHAASRFLRSTPSTTRTVAAGATGAVVAAPLGLAAYDLLSLRTSTETVWGLAALALVANEELGVLPVPLRRRAQLVPRPAFALGLLGLAGGFALALAVPPVHAIDALVTTVHPRSIAVTQADNQYSGKVLAQTACLVLDHTPTDVSVECRDRDRIPGGVAEVRIEAGDRDAVVAGYDVVAESVIATFPHAVVTISDSGSARPTWATTAPLWMFALGFALGTLVPDRAYRSVTTTAPIVPTVPTARSGH